VHFHCSFSTKQIIFARDFNKKKCSWLSWVLKLNASGIINTRAHLRCKRVVYAFEDHWQWVCEYSSLCKFICALLIRNLQSVIFNVPIHCRTHALAKHLTICQQPQNSCSVSTVLRTPDNTGNATTTLQTLLIGLAHHLLQPDNQKLSAQTSAQ